MRVKTQRCKGECDRIKALVLFYREPSAPSGRDSVCVACRLKAKRERLRVCIVSERLGSPGGEELNLSIRRGAVLTQRDVRAIREELVKGQKTKTEIGIEFGVSGVMIGHIDHKKSWGALE